MGSILNIRKATRTGARLVFAFAGTSGSGKTRTAIEFGYGLAGYKPEKLGFLDTENRRGSLYADVLRRHPTHPTDEPFLIADLDAPFAPLRYAQAVKEFQAAGVEVLVIDTYSHVWEGDGGCIEIAKRGRGVGAWKEPKEHHKEFVSAMLAAGMHVILCVRAREKIDTSDSKNPRSLGVLPICEKNLMFEMSASMLMDGMGKYQDVMKCPEELAPFLGRGEGYITSEDGFAVRQWVDGAVPEDKAVEAAYHALRQVVREGVSAYRNAWTKTGARERKALEADGRHTKLKAEAEAFDNNRSGQESDAAALNGAEIQ